MNHSISSNTLDHKTARKEEEILPMKMPSAEGIFALYKPLGITSQRAVQIVKYWARAKSGDKKIKVGHGGTLDPLAEGVLVIAVGRQYTREIDVHVQAQKEYIAEITLGQTSSTDDAEGIKKVIGYRCEVTEAKRERELFTTDVKSAKSKMESEERVKGLGEGEVSREEIEVLLREFVGEISQVPPAYSAIKISGQEAYKRVRRGEEVVMPPRLVEIHEIEFLSYAYPLLKIRVVCGKGTYIRSLARDIGKRLGTGAYLSHLLRTRVGTFTSEDALQIDEFKQDVI